ncbi:S-adenosyl-L-methionine-dependent methyltransferase [Sporodiniella umbellata]|nr:S-adenosyl-L-methionine-dependent methyltransferase [Sporodiniella umbellata]
MNTTCSVYEKNDLTHHTNEHSAYLLPHDADDEELILTARHIAIRDLYGGNVLPSIKKQIDFKTGVCVLDVGCGSGIWVMDMITDYPHCVYHGCDIVDSTRKAPTMKQFRFDLGDVVKGLPYADNSFDFVHMRSLMAVLKEKEWPVAIKELLRVTKPNGMIQLSEIDIKWEEARFNHFDILQKGVDALCRFKEVDCRIAMALEKLVLENKNAEVIESDYRECNMKQTTLAASNFKWNYLENTEGQWDVLISFLDTKTTMEDFLQGLQECLNTEDCSYFWKCVAVQKKA